MKLAAALAAIAPACKPTARFLRVPLVVADGAMRAYNGQLAAIAPLDDDLPAFTVDAGRFARAYADGATIFVADKFVTLRRGKVSFRLGKLDGEIVAPPILVADAPLSVAQQAAIKLAARFASTNALHPWACAVNVTPSGAIATNNQTLVFVPCAFDFAAALPFWALEALPDGRQDISIAVGANAIAFRRADGALLQAARLAENMPDVVARTVAELAPARDPLPDAAEIFAELALLGGRTVLLSPGGIMAEGEQGEHALAEIGALAGSFRMTIETAKLVFSVATHIDFDLAPGKLRFSKATEPRLIGFAAGMR